MEGERANKNIIECLDWVDFTFKATGTYNFVVTIRKIKLSINEQEESFYQLQGYIQVDDHISWF